MWFVLKEPYLRMHGSVKKITMLDILIMPRFAISEIAK